MRRGAKLDIEIERGTAEYSPRNSYISGIVRKNYCEVCGAKDKKLEVHHIVPVYLGKHIGWLGRRLRAGQPPSAKADGLSLPDPAGRDDRLVD